MTVELAEDWCVGHLDEDEGARFGEFFNDHYVRLGRAIYLMTGDRAEAEDVAQEAMVRVYERWERVSRMDAPAGYLYRIAMNLVRSRLRRLRRDHRRPLEIDHLDPITRAEDRADVVVMLARLPGQQRSALVLIDWLGFDADEAARVMGVKNSTMRVHLSRARKSFRALMETDSA
jgi:RNA polymerase sigma-70 factor, ECF subfamily